MLRYAGTIKTKGERTLIVVLLLKHDLFDKFRSQVLHSEKLRVLFEVSLYQEDEVQDREILRGEIWRNL